MKRLVWFFAVLASGTLIHAAVINVPADQPTIQDAIDVAQTGDTVLVAPGTYLENINFSGKNITVKSSNGNKVTIIDGGHNTSVVTFDSGEGRKAYSMASPFRMARRTVLAILRVEAFPSPTLPLPSLEIS